MVYVGSFRYVRVYSGSCHSSNDTLVSSRTMYLRGYIPYVSLLYVCEFESGCSILHLEGFCLHRYTLLLVASSDFS